MSDALKAARIEAAWRIAIARFTGKVTDSNHHCFPETWLFDAETQIAAILAEPDEAQVSTIPAADELRRQGMDAAVLYLYSIGSATSGYLVGVERDRRYPKAKI